MRKSIKQASWVCGLFLALSQIGNAQDGKSDIKGEVQDAATGNALIGVSISVKGNSRVTDLTNKTGRYHIRPGAKDTIQFTYVGYERIQIAASDLARNSLVKMVATDGSLGEVVIIGYGTVKKRDLTGSVGLVDMKDITKAPVSSVDQALAGRIAGVQVSSNEGQPGADVNITIRGGNSLTQSNAPLFVVDGFPIEDFSLQSLNPEDVASISVLKDASATAIYGSRGANGVIIIETKKGRTGPPVIAYDGYYGRQHVTKKIDMMSPYDFVKYQLEINPAPTTEAYLTKPSMALEEYRNVKGVDWQGLMFRPSNMHNHNISVRGGNSNTQYAFSGNLVDQDGIIISSGFKRRQARVSIDQVINTKLKVSTNINYSRSRNYGAIASSPQSDLNTYASYMMYRIWGYRPASVGNDIVNDLVDEDDVSSLLLLNPVIAVRNEIRQQTQSDLLINAAAIYSITKDLTLNIRGGYRSRSTRNEAFYNSNTFKGHATPTNTDGVNGSYGDLEMSNWVNENTLTWKKAFNDNNLMDVTGGFTMQGTNNTGYGFITVNVPNEELGLRALQQGVPNGTTSVASRNTLVSYLGRVNYNFKSKYLFTASLRADGSSKFTAANRWGIFPSGAFAWQMANEKFMKGIPAISDAKFRVSYGVTGNNRIDDFARFQSIDISDYYSFNNQTPGYAAIINNMGNYDLKWEKTAQLDIGYDMSLFNGRVNLTVDVYRKTTSDLLLNSNLPLSTGFNTVYKNIGKIRNDGLEFTLNTVNIRKGSFTWESGFNISFNKNKVLALAEGQTNMGSSVRFTGDFNSTFLYLAQVGGPAAVFYGLVWDGNYQYEDFDLLGNGTYALKQSVPTHAYTGAAIQPGDIKYKDQNGDGIVDEKDFAVLGRAIPVHIGGFTNNFTYKGFSLGIFFQWSYGNKIMNANRVQFEGDWSARANFNQYATYVDRWTPDNPTNEYPRAGSRGQNGVWSSRTLEDGSFLRLKTVQLGYSFPKKLIGNIKSLQVYAAGQNLYTWTKYSGLDPEVSVRNSILTPGFDISAYPRALTVTVGAKVTF